MIFHPFWKLVKLVAKEKEIRRGLKIVTKIKREKSNLTVVVFGSIEFGKCPI